MAKNDGVVVGLLLGGGALAAYLLAKQSTDAGGGDVASMTGGGEGASAAPGSAGGFSYYDPATGQILSPEQAGFQTVMGPDGLPREVPTTLPTLPNDQPIQFTPQFSPGFEDQLLKQNEDVNRQIVAEQQKQTRANQLGNVATVGLLGAAVAPTAIRVAAKTPALFRAVAPSIARVAAPLARVAGPVGAGLALGEAGVYALQKTGALDQVQKFGQSTIGKAPQPVQATVKTVALPLSLIGAVATAGVGRGSVQENVRSAFRGTFIDQGIKFAQRKWF